MGKDNSGWFDVPPKKVSTQVVGLLAWYCVPRGQPIFSMRSYPLQLHALVCNLGHFIRRLALPKEVECCSLTTLREKLVKIGDTLIRHVRYVTVQVAEGAVSTILFQKILTLVDDLRRKPVPA